jgi:lysophospholipase L1-like esterase
MDRSLARVARLIGAALGAFVGVVALQIMRLRRAEFLPGWPGFAVDHVVQPATGATRSTPLNLIVLGDSTTVGVGVDRPEDALPYRLARRLADVEGRPVRVVSFGAAGARVADLADNQLVRASGPTEQRRAGPFLPSADVVAIVIGSNDATHRTPTRRYRADLRATLEGVRAAAPRARLVLAGIPRFRGALRAFEPLILLTDAYARRLRPISRDEAARVGAAYADIYRAIPPMIKGRTDVLARDQFHPSAVLYDAWAQVIFDALAGAVESPPLFPAAPWEPAGA